MRLPERSVTASPAPDVTVPEAASPGVSLVLVTYGTGSVVVETIGSLVESVGDLPIEVIVVDNPHPDHPDRARTELLLSTAGVRLIRPDVNTGFGGGCELGAMHASAPVIGFVNPDVTFPAGWLPPLLDALLDEPAPAIVAPMLVDPDGTLQEAGQTLHRNGDTTPNLDPPPDTRWIVDYASAACWLMRRDEHERLGGFDPAYHPAYFEDVDLAWRARRAGGTCVVHTGVSVVHHRGTGTPGTAPPAFAQRDVLLQRFPEIRWRD